MDFETYNIKELELLYRLNLTIKYINNNVSRLLYLRSLYEKIFKTLGYVIKFERYNNLVLKDKYLSIVEDIIYELKKHVYKFQSCRKHYEVKLRFPVTYVCLFLYKDKILIKVLNLLLSIFYHPFLRDLYLDKAFNMYSCFIRIKAYFKNISWFIEVFDKNSYRFVTISQLRDFFNKKIQDLYFIILLSRSFYLENLRLSDNFFVFKIYKDINQYEVFFSYFFVLVDCFIIKFRQDFLGYFNVTSTKLYYERYLSNILIGISGCEVFFICFQKKFSKFCSINLFLKYFKIHLIKALNQKAFFLHLFVISSIYCLRPHISLYNIYFELPYKILIKVLFKSGFCTLNGISIPKFIWLGLKPIRILCLYNIIYYGLLLIYKIINNKKILYYLYIILRSSMAKLLAAKLKLKSSLKVYNKYGIHLCIYENGKQYDFLAPLYYK